MHLVNSASRNSGALVGPQRLEVEHAEPDEVVSRREHRRAPAMVEVVERQRDAVIPVARGSVGSGVGFCRNIRVLHPQRLKDVLAHELGIASSRRLLDRVFEKSVAKVRVLEFSARPRDQDAIAPDCLGHRWSSIRLTVKEEMVVQGEPRNVSSHPSNRRLRRIPCVALERCATQIVFNRAVELDLAALHKDHQSRGGNRL